MLLRLLLLIVWTPRATHTEHNSEKQEGGGGPHQHSYNHCQPLHLLLDHLILMSTAIFVVGSPTAEHIDSLITGRAVEPSVPLA